MTAPIVALDTETTGLHAGRQAWDIAMIRRDDTGEHTAQFYVDIDLSGSDPFALNMGRFWQRHPVGRYMYEFAEDVLIPKPLESHDCLYAIGTGDDPEFVTERTAAFLVAHWTLGAHIIGAVPNFDTETLAPLLRKHGLTPTWHYHLIDVEALAVGYRAGKGTPLAPPWKSDELSGAIGIEPPSDEERHTALGDARWALRVYDAIVGGAA